MDETDLVESLAVAGLGYLGLADADFAYVPPKLASFGGAGGTLVAAVEIGPDESRRVVRVRRACSGTEFGLSSFVMLSLAPLPRVHARGRRPMA